LCEITKKYDKKNNKYFVYFFHKFFGALVKRAPY